MGDAASSASAAEMVGRAVGEVREALNEHADVVAELFGRVSSDLRSGFRPALDSFLGFFHAVDWKEPWLISMLIFHAILLLVTIISRRNVNFQLILSALTFSGVFLAERINTFLGQHWKSFSSQNYFDPQGLFISVVWSGPLLLITILILVNTLVTLCLLMVRWKRAELRHRAREVRNKQD
ncbi:uncharacterized protein [Oryza sativa Japonica Group]|jgi:hypothetical protein|uniref:Transmembrane protein 18 n=7 Tax=Oryza TaxID=4527 RepID=Q69U50_ORYSJ|nr:transmembrane protein 18 [Oryza sativa Japonica Group]XP_052165381.1 uncharacterized protein LOC127782282 [Oryza glaberrima]EAZ05295.1 hypothetical protein OsI_27500 [Oryza sativa Indica Group]EAZ41235.1 hypothetical protein OsJ_25741 [Oryza sativa Japonica Group]KAF2917714.1 hypothetical protein DAI22_08g003100 [Oryza sativa Japonica Group]BAD33176.1 unknown protein [Oryza sativa Japonica Group]BAF22690.1 Os08g0104100 [Oryza sativa Japonica Group]|eukprot:NP_001060776.1 Os08g0104100 [Oryza sativa Japonica Group]